MLTRLVAIHFHFIDTMMHYGSHTLPVLKIACAMKSTGVVPVGIKVPSDV